jgi:hypothetical protein
MDWVFKSYVHSFVLKVFNQVITTFTATQGNAVPIQYLILMAVKLQIVISCVITYSMQKIKVSCLFAISVTTHTILTLTIKFIFICIPVSPEMVTTFNIENVINQSKKAPCKQRTGVKLFIYKQ